MVWLPYDAGLSVAEETLMGILKRVIVSPTVYQHFLEIAELACLSAIAELIVDIDRQLFRFVTIHSSDRQMDRIATAIPCIALHAVNNQH